MNSHVVCNYKYSLALDSLQLLGGVNEPLRDLIGKFHNSDKISNAEAERHLRGIKLVIRSIDEALWEGFNRTAEWCCYLVAQTWTATLCAGWQVPAAEHCASDWSEQKSPYRIVRQPFGGEVAIPSEIRI